MGFDAISMGNVPYWGWLPMGITNFGGDRQLFTIDTRSTAPIGMALNGYGQYAVNGWYSQPIYNNWGINNPVGYNFNNGYGLYC